MSANTYVVNQVGDVGTGSGYSGDIRYCINQADISPNAGSTIQFAATLSGSTIALSHGELAITDNMTITGLGPSSLTIGGGGLSRVFDITTTTAQVTISSLTISGGSLSSSIGGGIVNRGSLTLSDCNISGNTVSSEGAGIYNAGTVVLTDSCTLSDNSAKYGGGIFSVSGGTLKVSSSTLSSNTASSEGGAVYNTGTLTLSRSALSGNRAADGGGLFSGGAVTIGNASTLTANNAKIGGALLLIQSGTLTLNSSTLSRNTASANGGGVFSSGTLTVTNSSTLSGNTAQYGGGIDSRGTTLTIGSSSLAGNSATYAGGGILSGGTVTISPGSTLSGNNAKFGGALFVISGGSVTLNSSTLSSNSASADGGGIWNDGTAAVTGSTLSDNISGVYGGGLCNNGKATVINSTLAGNFAGVQGGGINNRQGGGRVTLTNATLAGNSASSVGGGIGVASGAVLLHNTLVAGNLSGGNPSDVSGTLDSSSNYNLVGDGIGMTGINSGSNGNQVGTSASPLDPLLTPLGNYGGPTQTMALLAGSPAIDSGSSAYGGSTDQRGGPRAGGTDIGAFQFQPFPNNQVAPPLPPPTGTVIDVSTVSQLESAVTNLKSGQTIVIAPGTYKLPGTLYVPQGLTNIAIRGATGNSGDVVIEGDAVLDSSSPYTGSAIWGTGSGISGTIPFGIWLGNVQGVTIADMTIQNFVDDAILLNAGVQSPLIHNVVMKDVGEQFIKSNPNGSGGGVNNGIVEYCTMEYSTLAPNNYTNGIDLVAAQNWIIRYDLFKNIATTNPLTTDSSGALAGPAILVWQGSSNATVENNTFINCQREIAFGLSPPSSITDDNTGGIIENNIIYRNGTQHGDVAIGVWNSPNTEVAYNTVILNGDYVNAVECRFATTTGVKILYNLTDAAIAQRDSASATVTGNVTSGAQSSWFVNESIGDLLLTSAATGAIGKGNYLPEVSIDYDGLARPNNGPTDVGADEYHAVPHTGPTVTSVTPSNNASNVYTGTVATVRFSEALDPTTVTSSTIQLLNSSGNSVAASVSYNSSTFTATLTPTAALSTSSTYTILVHGGSNGAVIKDAAGTPLAANFNSAFKTEAPLTASAGPTEPGKEGSAVQFVGSASGGTGGLSYSWNFGDGSTATGTLTPSHTYTAYGTYTVKLTVTDSAQESIQSTTTATIADVPPTANAGGPYSGAVGTAINFTGSASDIDPKVTISYLWNFGDGTTSTQLSPSHAYAAAKTYNVTFTVTGSDGLSTTATTTATVASAGTTSNEPLLYQTNIQYVGAFRVPAVPDPLESGDNTYDYGGTALAYDPANNGLFLVGMPYDQAISEISIPQSIVNSSNVANLATAAVLQAPVQVLNSLPNNPPIPGNSGGLDIGGLMVFNGTLVGTAYANYDAGGAAVYSHFALNSLNLSTATVSGLYQVGNLGAGLVAGYMTPIPTEWQSALGATDLTGQSDLNIISRTSSGPAAFGFNASSLGSSVTPDTPYVYYPTTDQLGPYEGPADPLESGTTSVGGVVFVPGTSSILYFGATGTNYEGYGLPGDYGDNVNSAKGPHSLNGQYAFQVWAYNANDLVAVKQGRMQPWQVQPYDVWNFTLPIPGSEKLGGVAFDAATGRIYVSVLSADTAKPYSTLPLIEVFQVAMTPSSASGPAAPQVGTLAATTTQPAPSGSSSPYAPGPIPSGTPVLLTAGNVYPVDLGVSALDPNLTLTQVAFYLETNSTGVPEPNTDELLGYGTPSTIANANHNWTLTMSTAGLTAGTYTIYVRALDSNGNWSAPVLTTLTVS